MGASTSQPDSSPDSTPGSSPDSPPDSPRGAQKSPYVSCVTGRLGCSQNMLPLIDAILYYNDIKAMQTFLDALPYAEDSYSGEQFLIRNTNEQSAYNMIPDLTGLFVGRIIGHGSYGKVSSVTKYPGNINLVMKESLRLTLQTYLALCREIITHAKLCCHLKYIRAKFPEFVMPIPMVYGMFTTYSAGDNLLRPALLMQPIDIGLDSVLENSRYEYDMHLFDIFVQLTYQLHVLQTTVNFVHGDLHIGNIALKERDMPKKVTYVIGNDTLVLNSKYITYIIDFGETCFTDHNGDRVAAQGGVHKNTDYCHNMSFDLILLFSSLYHSVSYQKLKMGQYMTQLNTVFGESMFRSCNYTNWHAAYYHAIFDSQDYTPQSVFQRCVKIYHGKSITPIRHLCDPRYRRSQYRQKPQQTRQTRPPRRRQYRQPPPQYLQDEQENSNVTDDLDTWVQRGNSCQKCINVISTDVPDAEVTKWWTQNKSRAGIKRLWEIAMLRNYHVGNHEKTNVVTHCKEVLDQCNIDTLSRPTKVKTITKPTKVKKVKTITKPEPSITAPVPMSISSASGPIPMSIDN